MDDPGPGVRLTRAGVVLGRFTPDDAVALAVELASAAGWQELEQTVQPQFLTAADLAAHFGVGVNTVHRWRGRYGPGRPAAQIRRVPVCPQPDLVVGRKRMVAVWAAYRLPEWEAWRACLNGQGGQRDARG
jgi:hypothetical protein